MKNFIKSILYKQAKNLVGITQEQDSKKFVLSYNDNPIGYLKHKDNKWIFVYSGWFKSQDSILPLIEFPNSNQIYRSSELWSFFSSRIPSSKQPKVKEFNAEGVMSIDELLEKFGQSTVNNPFTLDVV